MLNHIIAFCLRNRLLVLGVSIVLVVYGAREAARLGAVPHPALCLPQLFREEKWFPDQVKPVLILLMLHTTKEVSERTVSSSSSRHMSPRPDVSY